MEQFIAPARELQEKYSSKLYYPVDLAVDRGGRVEVDVDALPVDELIVDIGHKTVEKYLNIVNEARTIFVNGPAGVYEQPVSAYGTQALWEGIAAAPGYSVIGGGDSVASSKKFGVKDKLGYVCTSGGGLIRFLSGKELPVVTALRQAYQRWRRSIDWKSTPEREKPPQGLES